MKKPLLFILLSILTFVSSLNAQNIGGFWKSIDEKTGQVECLVAIYEYQEKYYGRIISTYNHDGVMDGSIYAPHGRAGGVKGHPYYCGLDIIWNLHDSGSRYKGKIMDPRNGNVYDAELWIKNGNLVVRGKLLFFGSSRTWLPAQDSDFSASFPKPNVKTFVPVIYE